MRLHRVLSLLVLLLSTTAALAQSGVPEYRAYWVDTFNTALGTRADIDRVIEAAELSNANTILAQVRRRGDSWYLDSREPLTQVTGVGEPDASGDWTIDPLRELVNRAHAKGMEVHAYVIIGTIYNAHPTITGLPRDPRHAFSQHVWDLSTNSLFPITDPRQWSTRVLPHHVDGTTFEGRRFGAEWYIDLGHPEAAAYTVDVLTHLVSRYDVDGIHLDRIRYPEAPIDRLNGKPMGINVGYNEVNVQRFKTRIGNAATYYTAADIGTRASDTPIRAVVAGDVGYPRTNDPLWNQWRRDQVTNFVRRLYLNTTAVKPRIKVSAALITFWTGPVGSGGWEKTEAYYRVFQDWKAWTEEGILDIVMPMNYKREHTSDRLQFDDYLTFTRALTAANNRHSAIGLGSYINSIEGTLRQARKSLGRAPFDDQPAADGVVFYHLADTKSFDFIPAASIGAHSNVAVTANPYSYPAAGVNTPRRSHNDFFAALTTGATKPGVRLESPALAPLFSGPVAIPAMPWKETPTTGHLMGFARRGDGSVIDSGDVTIARVGGSVAKSTVTDGGGFYGGVDLAPGQYIATATLGTSIATSCVATVSLGQVTSADLAPNSAPSIAGLTVDKPVLAVPNHQMEDVTLSYDIVDNCAGSTVTLSVTSDEERNGRGDGNAEPDFEIVDTTHVRLRAERKGNGDGRTYTITVTATDVHGETTSATVNVLVPHDQR